MSSSRGGLKWGTPLTYPLWAPGIATKDTKGMTIAMLTAVSVSGQQHEWDSMPPSISLVLSAVRMRLVSPVSKLLASLRKADTVNFGFIGHVFPP